MQTIKKSAHSRIERKRSLFLAFLVPSDQYRSERLRLRALHPKANHIAEATRNIDTTGKIEEFFSDDGEPKGCAGMPILNHLRGKDMVGISLFVVRYFGGIKLGTGGMARAYADAAKAVIESAKLHPYILRSPYSFESHFSKTGRFDHFFKNLGIDPAEKTFTANGVLWRLHLSEEERNALERFRKELGELL